jgi:hypothetical protein
MATELASTAKKSYGFTVSYRRTGGVFAEIHNLIDFTPPSIANTEVEKTHHGSPERKREFGLTLGESAPFDLKIHHNWDDATHQAMYEDAWNLVETSEMQIEWPDSDKTVSGIVFIKDWKWGSDQPGNLQEATLTVRESPVWNWA